MPNEMKGITIINIGLDAEVLDYPLIRRNNVFANSISSLYLNCIPEVDYSPVRQVSVAFTKKIEFKDTKIFLPELSGDRIAYAFTYFDYDAFYEMSVVNKNLHFLEIIHSIFLCLIKLLDINASDFESTYFKVIDMFNKDGYVQY